MKYKIVAEDGTEFDTKAECRDYEELIEIANLLSDKAPFQILDAIHRKNLPLANAIERAGTIIAAKRRESGDLRRKKSGSTVEDVKRAMEKQA